MRIPRLRAATSLLVATLISGCVSLGGNHPEGRQISRLPPAGLPDYEVSDRIYYSNGRYEKVVDVEGEEVLWQLSRTRQFRRVSNFVLPGISWDSTTSRGSYHTGAKSDLLWPLRAGNEGTFSVQLSTEKKDTGVQGSYLYYWRCEVAGSERVSLIAGDFDTFRVDCVRTNQLGQFRQKRTWYYAPRLGQFVSRVDQKRGRPNKRMDMLAFVPSLKPLDDDSYRRFWHSFRKTMETVPTGKAILWRHKGLGVSVKIEPYQTLKQQDGTYCRQFTLAVTKPQASRQGAGIACRDAEGRWRIPKQISADSGVEFRG